MQLEGSRGREKGVVANAIDGQMEKPCPPRDVILCGFAKKRPGVRGLFYWVKIPHAGTCAPVSFEDFHSWEKRKTVRETNQQTDVESIWFSTKL